LQAFDHTKCHRDAFTLEGRFVAISKLCAEIGMFLYIMDLIDEISVKCSIRYYNIIIIGQLFNMCKFLVILISIPQNDMLMKGIISAVVKIPV
jgi:hypothetical protein